MNVQTVNNDLAQPATPSAPAGGGASSGQHRPGSVESLVDAAMGAFAEEAPQNDNGREQVARGKKARDADADADEQEQGAVGALDGAEAADEQPQAEAEGAEVEHEEDLRGTKEEPYTVKDLPKDKYIEIKVDGEKMVVSMDELASGYSREQAFTRRVNKTKLLADEAQAMLQKAHETQGRTRSAMRELLHDPQQIYDFFLATEEREKVFETAARKYAELRRAHRENPDQRLAFQRQRDIDRLNWEREQFESGKQREAQERTQKQQLERARSIFEPGWQAGMRKAGFPEYTPALWDEVMLRCNQKHQRGEAVTTDDVADFVVRSAKLLQLPPRGGKGKPAPAPVAPHREAAPASRQKDPWANKSRREKLKSPEFFLHNVRLPR